MGACGCNDACESIAWVNLPDSVLVVDRYYITKCDSCGWDSKGRIGFQATEFKKDWHNVGSDVRDWIEDQKLVFLGKVTDRRVAAHVIKLAEGVVWYPDYIKLRRSIRDSRVTKRTDEWLRGNYGILRDQDPCDNADPHKCTIHDYHLLLRATKTSCKIVEWIDN